MDVTGITSSQYRLDAGTVVQGSLQEHLGEVGRGDRAGATRMGMLGEMGGGGEERD